MKFKLTLIAVFASLTLLSCDFNKSVKVDMVSGLTSKGDGLASSDVYVTVKDDKVSRTNFVYGEVFYVNFRNVTGFVKEGENVFPGMEIAVVGVKGDTVMYYEDLYADKAAGVDLSPLFMYTNITVAKPMNSNNNYKLYVNIWDKKGKGTFKTTMDFDVVPNKHIKIEKDKSINYNDVYLFSKDDRTVTDNVIKFNQTYYMIFEGLDGFAADNGKTSIGLSIKATSANGEILLVEQDLLGDEEYDVALIKEQVSANFIFTDTTIQFPVECEFVVYDKKSDLKLKANISLQTK